ncbi:hypothetical protein QBD01_001068 [Ochrobactrum sp. 19YEA23]|uniref:hypothetical protein n=1 Tax=Ochrobactrum sp. 19YEA23 TaxID=3039854 RepID=UPI00247A0C5F|nr:hypothetical protein [Ochrobactrum sp. 19YEA23]
MRRPLDDPEHPRREDEPRDEIEMFIRDAYAAGCSAGRNPGGALVAFEYAHIHAPKLRALLPHQPESIFVPAGWQLVPKEPTFQMASAAIHLDPKSDLDAKYRAMLAAAPSYSAVDEEAFICIACSKVVQEGELVFHEYGEGGLIHAECLGSDRESYCSDDGQPLGPDDPLPTPFPYKQGQ